MIGKTLLAARSASALSEASALLRAFWIRGLPSLRPFAFVAARAAFVRPDIKTRSFSASAAYRCRTQGSASEPSSETMKAMRCDRSVGAFAGAAASCGRRSGASLPLPVQLRRTRRGSQSPHRLRSAGQRATSPLGEPVHPFVPLRLAKFAIHFRTSSGASGSFADRAQQVAA